MSNTISNIYDILNAVPSHKISLQVSYEPSFCDLLGTFFPLPFAISNPSEEHHKFSIVLNLKSSEAPRI